MTAPINPFASDRTHLAAPGAAYRGNRTSGTSVPNAFQLEKAALCEKNRSCADLVIDVQGRGAMTSNSGVRVPPTPMSGTAIEMRDGRAPARAAPDQ